MASNLRRICVQRLSRMMATHLTETRCGRTVRVATVTRIAGHAFSLDVHHEYATHDYDDPHVEGRRGGDVRVTLVRICSPRGLSFGRPRFSFSSLTLLMSSRPARPSAFTAVHKFGGAALADAAAIRHAATILSAQRGGTRGSAVVASAMGGVTDALYGIGTLATGGSSDRAAASAASEKLRQRHLTAAAELAADEAQLQSLRETIEREFADLAEILEGVADTRSPLSAVTTDAIVARGERISAHLLATALNANGVRAPVVDAT